MPTASERTRPVRVTFVIGTLEIGGSETQLVRLANHLDRGRFAPAIICLFNGGPLEAQLASDVPVIKGNLRTGASCSIWRRPALAVGVLRVLVRGIRRQKPEIVHGYLPAAYVLGGLCAWLLRVHLIVAGRRGLTSYQAFRFRSMRFLARLANRVIDVHVCNSRAVQEFAIKSEDIPARKTCVVYNGIDLPAQPANARPAEPDSGGPRAAMIANLIAYKGHRLVLDSVAEVLKRHKSFRLVLFGDGPEHRALAERARQLNIDEAVTFAGSRADAAALLGEFQFTILGSSEEGFPNAVMESMAHGVPVVSTSVGGVGELVEDGVEGRLVPHGDPSALAEAINWMIEHDSERLEMGRRARQKIGQQFSTADMVAATESAYLDFWDTSAPKPSSDRPRAGVLKC